MGDHHHPALPGGGQLPGQPGRLIRAHLPTGSPAAADDVEDHEADRLAEVDHVVQPLAGADGHPAPGVTAQAGERLGERQLAAVRVGGDPHRGAVERPAQEFIDGTRVGRAVG